jgi:hypothetical protein
MPKAGWEAIKDIRRRMSGARIFPRLYRKKIRTSRRRRITSPVQTRLPFRLAGRFCSGLSLTGLPAL